MVAFLSNLWDLFIQIRFLLWNCTVLIYTETQKVKAEELVDTGIGNTRKLQKLLVENRVFL